MHNTKEYAVLNALAGLGGSARWEAIVREVGAWGGEDEHERSRAGRRLETARASLRRRGLIRYASGTWELTEAGRRRLRETRTTTNARTRTRVRTRSPRARARARGSVSQRQPLLKPGVIARPLLEEDTRQRLAREPHADGRIPVLIELNRQLGSGPNDAFERLRAVWPVAGGEPPRRVSEDYATGELPMEWIERLVVADQSPESGAGSAVHRVWPDFPVQPLINESNRTVKADAARRSFDCRGERIVWAVIDSGISGGHPHFQRYNNLHGDGVDDLHRNFTSTRAPELALVDEKGHGTHVAGIIAGGLEQDFKDEKGHPPHVFREDYTPNGTGTEARQTELRPGPDPTALCGVAPAAKLVSLKVVESGTGAADRVSRLIEALAYVREVNGAGGRNMRIHGVNISLGHEFEPRWFACGHSPICAEVDKLVRSGVVVVVAAGNTGFGGVSSKERSTDIGLQMTINDPGNAERAITVGSTHREQPHTYGVSYFSSKGPTGDGRYKPDLVAPGERIVSCAVGQTRPAGLDDICAAYAERTGTSMAAPHVSGAVAAFLSSRREFVGEPERVKRIFMDAATSLGRSPYFQGSGLLDLMRALQSV